MMAKMYQAIHTPWDPRHFRETATTMRAADIWKPA